LCAYHSCMLRSRTVVRNFARVTTVAMSTTATNQGPLVSCQWLREQQAAPDGPTVKPIDASWYLPAMKRDGFAEFIETHIPSAAFFDVDATDDTSNLPHMLPSADFFAKTMTACGVTNADHVVVYDGKGLFSAARLWWMLRAYGHERVSVLDGGLPAWVAEGFPTESGPAAEPAAGAAFAATLQPGATADAAELLAHVSAPGPLLIVDARSKERFEGTVAEARPGCRSGHIPTSVSVPFNLLLEASGKMKSDEKLLGVFSAAGVALDAAGPPLVTSCGSGVTAAVVQLALAKLGRVDRISLYDGSWAEWGGDEAKPLATGP